MLLLLNLSVFVCFAQSPVTQPPVNPHSKNLSVKQYDQLISYYRYLKPDSAAYLAKVALELAIKTHDDNGHALILNQIGMIDDNLGKVDESHQKYIEARDIYLRTGQKTGLATELVRLGVIESRKGNYDKAIGYYLDALKASEQSGNLKGKMESYLTLGEAYLGQNKLDTALNYLKLAENINNTIPFSNLTLNIYDEFGVIYGKQGKYALSKAYLEKGIALSNKPQYQGLNITLTNNLAAVYAKQGFKDTSIRLQKSALVKSIQINNYLRELQTLTGLAETYGKDDPEQALVYFKQALDLVKTKDAKRNQVDILGRMADMYHILHKDDLAYATKQQQYAIADEYFYQKMAKQISSLKDSTALGKSEANVQALKYENGRQELRQKVYIVITAGSVLLLLLMVLFYMRTQKLNLLLNSANIELKESNEVKDKLFSVLAHDLRSPFSAIINLLSLINDDILDAKERKDLINMAVVSSNASLGILNNLLKWGEMQIKGVRINQVDLWPHQIIERNIAVLSASAELKNIRIDNLVAKNFKVMADADHFEFVTRNLLSNAIKFTDKGGIVSISSEIDKAKAEVKFIVKDTGVGIKKERLQGIFNLGNVSTTGTNDEKGTSLGLVLCKEFVEANNGRIWAESVPGTGSEFMFVLKLA